MQRTNHGSFNWFAKLLTAFPSATWKMCFISNTYIHRGIYVQIQAQFSSVARSCPTICDPVDARPPCLSLTTGVYTNTRPWVGDAIQPSHPLSSPSPPTFSLSQHQDIFKWVSSLHEVAKVLEFQPQYQSFQWTPRTDCLLDGLIGSPCSPRDSQESSLTSRFKSINSLVLSFLYSPTLTSIHDYWKNHSFD